MKAIMACVIRTDLKLPKGRLITIGGDAFVNLITKYIEKIPFKNEMHLTVWADTEDPLFMWLIKERTKIAVAVDSEKELMKVYDTAKNEGLNTILVRDKDDVEPVKQPICIGIGPAWDKDINKVVGNLREFS